MIGFLAIGSLLAGDQGRLRLQSCYVYMDPQGFGETILCPRTIQHINTGPRDTAAYYFSSSGLESHKDPLVAMWPWIYHVISINASVTGIFSQKLECDVAASQVVAIELFRQVVSMISNCTFVVDGLDKYVLNSSWSSVAEFVKGMNQAVHGMNTRFLLMNPNESYIHQTLMEVGNTISFQCKVSEKDVRSERSKGIVAKKLSGEETTTRAEMGKKMSGRSKGQFFWPRLRKDFLRKRLNKAQLWDAVETTPAGFSCLYARSWAKISKLSNNYRARALLLPHLTAFSPRTLTVCEIFEAVLVDHENEDFSVCEFPDRWDKGSVKERILYLFHSILTLECKALDPLRMDIACCTLLSRRTFFSAGHRTIIPFNGTVNQWL